MPHSIKVRGFAPPELSAAPEALRRQFWQLVAPIALKIKDKELAAGLDAMGDPLRPISPATRKHRRSAMTPGGRGSPSAPPLMPAYQKSRVRSLLAARALPTHVELYWRYDPFSGASFDEILTYQREQGRDVFGVSPEGMAEIRRKSLAAWAAWKRAGLAPVEKRTAFPAAALAAGPQPRIAGIVARSAEPNAGLAARGLAGVGRLDTRFITRGIGAPTVKELKASTTRTGTMTREGWQRFFTEEVGGNGGGGIAVPRPPAPKAPRPKAAARPPAPAPVPGPAGRPVSQALEITATGKTREAIEGALSAIDRVHGDGALPRIPVKQTSHGSSQVGVLWHNSYTGEPTGMGVSSKGEHPYLTTVHEAGHFLDYGGIPKTHEGSGGTRFRDFRTEPQFAAWAKAIDESDAVKKLRDVMGKPYVVLGRFKVNEKPVESRYKIDAKHAKYLASDEELWARSYAQYITLRSGHPELARELATELGTTYTKVYGAQWSREDFAPIAAAFDDFFRKLGWIR